MFPILLYGVESWTLNQETNRIEAFELRLYKRVLLISWVDRITNKEVLERMYKVRDLVFLIKKRKLELLVIKCKTQGKGSV